MKNKKMIDNKTWIDNLRKEIIKKEDEILFNEAAGCFLSGYQRASYILSWLSIIESLKRKLLLNIN